MKKLFIALISMSAFICASCNQQNNVNKKLSDRELFVDAFNKINSALVVQKPSKSNAPVVDDSDLEASEFLENIDGTKCFIHFMELLYANNNYQINTNTNHILGHYKDTNGNIVQYNDFYLKAILDKENNKINTEAYGISEMKNQENDMDDYLYYDCIEIDYDFSSNTLNSFTIFSATAIDSGVSEVHNDDELGGDDVFFEVYKNKSLYDLRSDVDDNVRANIVDYYNKNYWNEYRKTIDEAANLGDFSTEYTQSINDLGINMDY